jgi:hypothetical protein
MQSFIVLGIIPGTNFQTTFDFWVYLSFAIAWLLFAWQTWRYRTGLHTYLIAFKIARVIDRYQFQLPA